jgi:hypothetical protein
MIHRGIVCGECGATLEERKIDGQWLTVCTHDRAHDTGKAMTRTAWQNRPGRRTMQEAAAEAIANEIFDHLPAEFRAEMRERKTECQLRD